MLIKHKTNQQPKKSHQKTQNKKLPKQNNKQNPNPFLMDF